MNLIMKMEVSFSYMPREIVLLMAPNIFVNSKLIFCHTIDSLQKLIIMIEVQSPMARSVYMHGLVLVVLMSKNTNYTPRVPIRVNKIVTFDGFPTERKCSGGKCL